MTTTPYHKAVIPVGPYDYDAFLNHRYIGSFPSASHAWEELDRVAYADATHSGAAALIEETIHLPAANPLLPFGVDAGPDPNLHQITAAAIARATEVLIDAYEDKPAIISRALSAYDLACLAYQEYPADPEQRTVLVRENGDLRIRGSKLYWITQQGCTCPDYRALVYGSSYLGSGAEAGLCKHVLAREILRLAHARQGIINPEQGNKTATVAIAATRLVRALRAVAQPPSSSACLTIDLAYTRIRLHQGDRHHVVSGHAPDWGIRSLCLDSLHTHTLIEMVAGVAKGTNINLLLDAGMGEVSLFGPGIGVSLPACPTPHPDEP